MPRRDVHLLRAPSELPKWEDFVVRGLLLGIIVACYIAEAEEDVGETVL